MLSSALKVLNLLTVSTHKNIIFKYSKVLNLTNIPYGACYHDLKNTLSTGVIEYLKCHNIITTVICGGLATDYCVKNTVLQLRQVGFEVILNKAKHAVVLLKKPLRRRWKKWIKQVYISLKMPLSLQA